MNITYYKNAEIARKYNVSVDTVANWIEATLAGKYNLELLKAQNRAYILKTVANLALLDNLAIKSRKFRNKKYLKKITPSNIFFKIYSSNQIMDLISNLELHKEIDMKFIYFGEGAKYWDDLYERSLKHTGFSIPNSTEEILKISRQILLQLAKKFENIEIIDLGVGNGKHIVSTLRFLIDNNFLTKYVAIDYSKDMLDIAQRNIKKELAGISLDEYHVLDLNYSSINEFLFKRNDRLVGKFIFFIGSTIENMRDAKFVLRLLKNSINKNDILILGNTLKNNNGQQLLNFSHNYSPPQNHRDGYLIVLDRLGIKEEYYDIIRYYETETSTRLVKVRLKYDLEIIFKVGNIERTLKLDRKELITVYRHKHNSMKEVNNLLDNEGFRVLHSITSNDYSTLVTICNVL